MTPWSFLKPIVTPYKWWFVLIFQAPIIGAFYIIINSYSFKLIIDAFSGDVLSYAQILFPIVLYVFGQVLLDVVWIVCKISQRKIMPPIRNAVLLKAYDVIQNKSFSYFQNTQSGSIISKINGVMEGYITIFSYFTHNLSKHFFAVLFSLFALLFVSKIAGLIMISWTICFFAFQYPMARRLSILSNLEGDARHKVFAFFADNITNIFTIFNFATKKRELNRIKTLALQPFEKTQSNTYRYNLKFYVVGCLFYWPMLIGIFLLMLYFRKNHIITSGDFAFVMTTIVAISTDLWVFLINLTDFLKEMGDFKSSFAILKASNKAFDKINATKLVV